MRRIITLLLAMAFSVLPLQAQRSEKDSALRVFILAGQSNMVGSDAHAEEIDRFPPFVGVQEPQADIRYWYIHGPDEPQNNSRGWIPLQPDRKHRFFGPELTFGRRVKESTGVRVAILKTAWGGTTLAKDWDPDAPSEKKLFERMITLVRTAEADLKKRRIKYRLEALLWHQGENDMLNRDLVGDYGKRLTAFIKRTRKDLNAPELKCFVGEISNKGVWGLDHRRPMQKLREQQRAVAAADKRVWFVPTSHLAFKVTKDGHPHYHFGTEGQLQHGEAYAEAYLETLDKKPRSPVEAKKSFGKKLPVTPGRRIRVFVLAGQRSAEGDGTYFASLSRNARKRLNGYSRVLYRYRSGDGVFQSEDWRRLEPDSAHSTFGPELSLGRELDRGLRDAVAIIKVTHSAAVLKDWLPESDNASLPQLEASLSFVEQGLADLKRRGYRPTLDGVFWIPGEHDAWWGPFRKDYAKDLPVLVQAFRKKFKAPKLPWIVAELSDHLCWNREKLQQLDEQIEKAAEQDPRLWFLRTKDLAVPSGSVTFGPKGTDELGRRLAQEFVKIDKR